MVDRPTFGPEGGQMPNQCLGTRKCSPFDVLNAIPEAIIMDRFSQKKVGFFSL